MMTSQKLISYATAEPFRPFSIRTASGRTYAVRHPEMVKIGRTTVKVYDSLPNAPSRRHDVSLILIESIETDLPSDPMLPGGTVE